MNDREHDPLDAPDNVELRQARLTAYALDQLDDEERRAVELELASDESSRQLVAQMQVLGDAVRQAGDGEQNAAASPLLSGAIENRLDALAVAHVNRQGDKSGVQPAKTAAARSMRRRLRLALTIAGCLLLGALPLAIAVMSVHGNFGRVISRRTAKNDVKDWLSGEGVRHELFDAAPVYGHGEGQGRGDRPHEESFDTHVRAQLRAGEAVAGKQASASYGADGRANTKMFSADPQQMDFDGDGVWGSVWMNQGGYDPRFGDAGLASTGGYGMGGYGEMMEEYGGEMMGGYGRGDEFYDHYGESRSRGRRRPLLGKDPFVNRLDRAGPDYGAGVYYPGNEQYDPIYENRFLAVSQQPLSTFSIDVDTASYANVRRFLDSGRLPPPAAVRIEELVNYFQYDDPAPGGDAPFAVRLEMTECPWRPEHKLLRVGLKGKEVSQQERPASNLVFLLDVSGSMSDDNKLPLLKSAMKMLAAELGENDRVAIVTYAGSAGLRLDSTRGHKTRQIHDAIDSLTSGGSTNGSAGIELAYKKAAEHFIQGGVNRVILATDGDLNVGVTDDDALVELIKRQAAGGVFLTVLGFGTGNLKDSKLEKLADNGNGAYGYIDSLREARRVLVEQISGSLVTIAKDVKIQIEFNPAEVAGYRLIGYENRLLEAADFDNDKKDAGEIGAGHSVTALYEIVPAGPAAVAADGESLKYQQPVQRTKAEDQLTAAAESGELLTVFLRYKRPDADESNLLEFALIDRGSRFGRASDDLRFAAAVAGFGMLLRGSEHRGSATLAAVEEIAAAAIGDDPQGYRTEFVDLVRKAAAISK